jgi:hypothetical protein
VRLLLHRVLAGQLGYQVMGNKVAELAEERGLSPYWLALSLLFHAPPCGRVQNPQANSFSSLNHQICETPVLSFLWFDVDGENRRAQPEGWALVDVDFWCGYLVSYLVIPSPPRI